MRRLSLLFAGGLLWLFLAAIPALADGGPHLTAINSGTSSLTADSCAGCHRAHTAQGEYLLTARSEEALCLSCHGAAGTGSTVDVEFGIQYVPVLDGTGNNTPATVAGRGSVTTYTVSTVVAGLITTSSPHGLVAGQSVQITGLGGIPNGVYIVDPAGLTATAFELEGYTPTYLAGATVKVTDSLATGVVLGALRDGGFLKARIASSDPLRATYPRAYADSPLNVLFSISTRPKVGVGASEAVGSAHIDLLNAAGNGIADGKTVWGKGALNSGVGTPSVTLGCVDCHNPHGNGNYRILRPVQGVEADPLGAPLPVAIKATYATTKNIVTVGQNALVVGDTVAIAGVTGLTDGTYYVASVVNGFTFKISSSVATIGTAIAVPNTTGLGTVVRPSVAIADVPLDPDSNGIYPVKNYTIIETKGQQGVNSTFLLYARDVLKARVGLGVATAQPAVAITGVDAIGAPAVYWFRTTVASGVAVGDLVTIASDGTIGGWTPGVGPYTVSAVASSGAIYDQFRLQGVTLAAGGLTGTTWTVSRNGIGGDYSAAGGDYFRRTVPWNPFKVNPSCDLTTVPTATNGGSAYCATMNDAPNGRPNAITVPSSGTYPSTLIGQQAFVDQISTWCAQCHTRYYSASNENLGYVDPPISDISNIVIGRIKATGEIYPVLYAPTGAAYAAPSYGDKVTFSGVAGANGTTLNGNTFLVVATGTGYFQVTALANGLGGAVQALAVAGASPYDTTTASLGTYTRTAQYSNSSWGYPRQDNLFKYQHSTSSNRACTVCHVAHGSNAIMPGQNNTTFAANVPYPDGTVPTTGNPLTGASSRLLKIDNRGTCQMCHEPTGTLGPNTLLGSVVGLTYNLVP